MPSNETEYCFAKARKNITGERQTRPLNTMLQSDNLIVTGPEEYKYLTEKVTH